MMGIILWLVIGGVVGWLASIVMKRDGSQGIFLNIVVGIVGAMLGGWLIGPMLGAPTIGPMSQPPSMAPTMPTTMFRKMPWLPSRFITMLASQPTTPPITNHRISPIIFSLVHARMTLALVRVQFVVESLEAAAKHIGRTSLVALEMFERRKNEGALDLIERRANGNTDFVVAMYAGRVA